VQFVRQNGDKDWAKLAFLLNGRTGKQCRERFKNHLDGTVVRQPWSEEEDQKLIDLHAQHGNSWTLIASFFDGKTDNCVKNRWNSTIKKRLERIEKGQPLVMKRGRKPKGYYLLARTSILPEDGDGEVFAEDMRDSAQCSSPVAIPPKRSVIELAINDKFTVSFPKRPVVSGEAVPVHNAGSVEQNRINLQKLLSDLV
jgi:hypothetical protein